MRSRFVAGVLAISVTTGCSFMQPTATGAPIADVVGVGIMGGATAIAVVEMDRTNLGAPDFGADGGYTAGRCTLAGLTLVYMLSAIYGFTRDPNTQQSEPILGLQILAAGLAGFGKGANSAPPASAAPRPSAPASSEGPATMPAFAPTPTCSSDLDCGGPGFMCSKPVGSFQGQCAKAVNSYGNQDFLRTPDPSLGPGKAQCQFTTDCPIGFACDAGRCVKY